MHNSLKIIKILLYSYSALHVLGTCAHHQEPPNSAHTASSHRVSLGWLYLPALLCHYCREATVVTHYYYYYYYSHFTYRVC
jgi:hypothetical protein